jgi:hypothetical protein
MPLGSDEVAAGVSMGKGPLISGTFDAWLLNCSPLIFAQTVERADSDDEFCTYNTNETPMKEERSEKRQRACTLSREQGLIFLPSWLPPLEERETKGEWSSIGVSKQRTVQRDRHPVGRCVVDDLDGI